MTAGPGNPRGDMPGLIVELRRHLPDVTVLTDPLDRESYRRDETAHLAAGLPGLVALPSTTDEVARLVRLAARFGVPIVPRGAGTGLSGGAAGIEGALTIALTRMNAILEIDDDNMVAVVQPGVINADLKQAVAQRGLFYAPDPASTAICSIGGNLGTNAGGLCCLKYGVTRDSVLGLEVVLADGSVIRTGGRTLKDVAGYALSHLFVGSGGTLGVITEATLRLRPLPARPQTVLAFFPSLPAAGAAITSLSRARVSPSTVELMDQVTIAAVDDWRHLGLDRSAAAMLLVESDLPDAAAEHELAKVLPALESAGASSIIRSANADEADWLRQARRDAYHALDRLGTATMEDVAVPRSRIADLLARIEALAAHHQVAIGTFGHAGDGNLHPTIVTDAADSKAAARVDAVRRGLYQAALDLGGTVTGEHGIGVSRRDWLEATRGARTVEVMRAIKLALDPQGILNPGKLLAADG